MVRKWCERMISMAKNEFLKAKIHENTYQKNGKTYTRYYFRFEGKRHYHSSYEEAYINLTNLVNGVDLRAELKEQKSNEIGEQLIKTEIVKWFNHYKKNVKASTSQRTHQVIELRIIPQLGNLKIKNLTQKNVQDLVNSCNSKSDGKKCFDYLQRFYKDIGALRLFEHSPFYKVKITDNRVKNEKATFTDSEIEGIKLNYHKYKYGFAFYLLATTGMRVGEVMALTLGDFIENEQGYSIKINKTVSAGVEYDDYGSGIRITEITTPKTKNGVRTIPIAQSIYEELIKYLGCSDMVDCDNYIYLNKNQILLRTKNGSRVPYKTLRNQFDSLLNDLSIEKGDRTLHSLRHTFATRAVERGANITNLSRYLGHASTSITYNVYVHGTAEGFRGFIEENT